MIDAIICLGNTLLDDGTPDWTLQSRLNKTVEAWNQNPNAVLILSGGKSLSSLNKKNVHSEATGMLNYLKENYSEIIEGKKIIIEEDSLTTIDQLCKIKLQILLPRGFKNIGLVTDEIHMPRATMIIQSILGKDFNVESFEAQFLLAGRWKQVIVDLEKGLYDLTKRTRVDLIKEGDHEMWQKMETDYQKKKIDFQESGGKDLDYFKTLEKTN